MFNLNPAVRVADAHTALPFTPADYVNVLHPRRRRGKAAVAWGGGRWTERAVPIAELTDYVAGLAGEPDLFVSQQSFYGWRRIAQLAQLGATYVDLDFYRQDRWSGCRPEFVTQAVLQVLDDADMPGPSYVLSTGRGLLTVWLHDLVPRAALPRWMAMQRHLAGILGPFGADRLALDAARVFRLAGTRNTKSGSLVRPTYLAASPGDLWRWDFDDLAREVLPWDRGEITALRAGRAQQAARRGGAEPACRLTGGTYWETVLSDLQRLRDVRWFGALPPGQRDAWLFTACVAMSWLAPASVLRREFNALAQEAGGWTEGEANSRMTSVFRRASAAAAGCKVEWAGKPFDPRYRFRAGTIVEWLGITPSEMREAGLRVLVDANIKREHSLERQRARRRRLGLQDRAAYEALAGARRTRVAELRQKGMTWRAIADELGISVGEAHRLGLQPPLRPVQGMSRCMVA